jgi:SET and MYND domain-containing protein 4
MMAGNHGLDVFFGGFRYFIGTSLVICSARTIKHGDVVAENYGPIFTSHSKSDRQSRLKGRYWFQCNCVACENNWPTYDGMPEMEDVLTRCLFCLGQVKAIPPQNTYVRCKSCKKQMMMSLIQEKTGEVAALYRSAMQAMDRMELEKAISLLSLFISVMERLDVGPVKERHLAEEALRLCVGTRGTKYCANNHLTLSVKPNPKKEEPQTNSYVSGGM